MGKLRLLKTSYLKRKIKEQFIKLALLDYKFFNKVDSKNKNILIMTMDALGDNIVKSRTIEILAQRYGQENTYILCKNKWESLYELQGYKNIFVDETKWNIFYKIKLYRKLNSIGFGTIAIMNHSHLPDERKFIFSGKQYDMSEDVEYILDKHTIILEKILGESFSLNDVIPDLRRYFPEKKYDNIISIAIGAAGKHKTLPYENLKNIVTELIKKFPQKNIILLGSGKKQNEVALKLKSELNNDKIENLIDKIELKEVMQIIKDSDLFVGGDSGLYNIAFTLKTNIICLHWDKNKSMWEHYGKNIKILKGKPQENISYIQDGYGTDILNSITVEQVMRAVDELIG